LSINYKLNKGISIWWSLVDGPCQSAHVSPLW